MKSKNILLIIVLIIALLAVGSFLYRRNKVVEAPVQGKLNITAVCEGALAYMSFPDGASAEIFVQDCKDGKHPEVIEKYKADMNLGDGAAV